MAEKDSVRCLGYFFCPFFCSGLFYSRSFALTHAAALAHGGRYYCYYYYYYYYYYGMCNIGHDVRRLRVACLCGPRAARGRSVATDGCHGRCTGN